MTRENGRRLRQYQHDSSDDNGKEGVEAYPVCYSSGTRW